MNGLELFHPAVRAWFSARLGEPTDVQSLSWPLISQNKNVLVSAPTGCGKTLAAFLWSLDRLLAGHWELGGLRVLYISPLKALNNDVRRNLLAPLEELEKFFREEGSPFPKIEVVTRSGDSTEQERRRLRRHATEILITTPESLNILLTQKSSRDLFSGLKTVILDEIHAVAGQKRGTSLITAVERLVPLAGEFQRIGLSATVNPPRLVADFLGGFERLDSQGEEDEFRPRPVEIVQSKTAKTYDVKILLPEYGSDQDSDKGYWESLALELKKSVRLKKSTLIFTNSRRSCEKLARLINENEDPLLAYSHHGSLSKEIRLDVEEKLKAGELKALVATNSLELGIDIGDLEEVVLAQTPRTASSAIQKTGRAGHQTGAVSRARLFPSHGIDLVEAAVVTQAIREQSVEPIVIPEGPLDVLAQIVLSALSFESLTSRELYLRLKASWPYRNLGWMGFELVLDMLAGRYAGTRIRELKPRLELDPVTETWKSKEEVPFLLFSSGGTIPDRGYFVMRDQKTGGRIGELDEEFVWERQLGDRFALGAQVWRIVQVTDTDVRVEAVESPPHIIPFWSAEDQDRSFFLAEKIGLFLGEAEKTVEKNPELMTKRLVSDFFFSVPAAQRLTSLLQEQILLTGCLPHRRRLVAEVVLDARKAEKRIDVNQVILHTFWGARVNRPWAFALSQAWEDRYGYALETYAGDDQILILAPPEASIEELLDLVHPEDLEGLLRRRLESTGYFGARFRESAGRALLLPKGGFRSRQPLWMTRIRSKKLLDAVLSFEDFPILLEAWRQCLHDEFELETLKSLLDERTAGLIELRTCTTTEPSPFTEGILWRQINEHMYKEDAPEGAQRSRLNQEVWNAVLTSDRPLLERGLIKEWEAQLQQTAPGYAPETVEDALDLLELRLAVPEEEFRLLLEGVQAESGIPVQEAKDRMAPFLGRGERGVYHLRNQPLMTDPYALLLRWLDYYGPVKTSFCKEFWGLDADRFAAWIAEKTADGQLLSGPFLTDSGEDELCRTPNWELLVRRNRLRRRKAVRSRPITDLSLFLPQFQGLTHFDAGIEVLQDRLEQLFGLPLPAALWEQAILPSRMNYLPSALDSLTQNSDLRWYGSGTEKVQLGLEEEKQLFTFPEPAEDTQTFLDLAFGNQKEAAFLDLSERTGLPTAALTVRLWELAWKGWVNNSSFETLRKGLQNRFQSAGIEELSPRKRRGFQRWAASRPLTGTWVRQPEAISAGDPVRHLEGLKERARLVLSRYGIVFRELLLQEQPAFQWRSLFPAFKMMELSGELTGGLFFEGLPGLQFASNHALEILGEVLDEEAIFVQHAQDPSSLCGLKVGGLTSLPRRAAGNWLWWKGSQPAGVLTASGKKLQLFLGADDPSLKVLVQRTAVLFQKYWTLETIDEVPAGESPRRKEFQDCGFRSHGESLILWKG